MRFTVLVNHNKILCWAVEKGWITNWRHHRKPSFEVIPALLSRCQVYILNFTKKDLESLLERP
jgi:putative ATPase